MIVCRVSVQQTHLSAQLARYCSEIGILEILSTRYNGNIQHRGIFRHDCSASDLTYNALVHNTESDFTDKFNLTIQIVSLLRKNDK